MSWYIHPSRQLRDDELPPELVVTNHDGSIEQAYVPYNASDKIEAENARLRELVRNLYAEWGFAHRRMRYIVLQHEERMRGIEQRMSELGVEVDE